MDNNKNISRKQVLTAIALVILGSLAILFIASQPQPAPTFKQFPNNTSSSGITGGEIQLPDNKIEYPPEPEKVLADEDQRWCVHWTPDGCVKWFETREQAKEYLLSEENDSEN